MKKIIIITIATLLVINVQAQNGSLNYLKKFEGKYPSDVKLFNTNPLKARLVKLLGNKVKVFNDNMGVQVPLKISNNTLVNTGCLPHSCGSDESAICVLFNTDNILVGIISHGKYSVYSEKPVSKDEYPQAYKDWLGNRINEIQEEQKAKTKNITYTATGVVVGDENEGNNYYRVDIRNSKGETISIWGPHSTWNKLKYYKNGKVVKGIKKGDKIGVIGTQEDSGIVPDRIDIL